MQKHKFDVTCPGAHFLEYVPVPHEHEIQCLAVSYTGCTGIHYVTRISHQMQKHKFGVMCLDALLLESVPVPSEQEK
jgi:hypothetical protein